MKMKGKRVIAGILLVGILAVTLAGCKNTGENKKETEKPVITLGSDSYPPYTYLNEDGVPTDQLGEEKRTVGERGDRLHHGLFFHGRAP